MLKSVYPYIDEKGNANKNLIKHYSDEGYYITQNETGEKYRIAIDKYPCRYTYTETDEVAPLPKSKEEEESDGN